MENSQIKLFSRTCAINIDDLFPAKNSVTDKRRLREFTSSRWHCFPEGLQAQWTPHTESQPERLSTAV